MLRFFEEERHGRALGHLDWIDVIIELNYNVRFSVGRDTPLRLEQGIR
jgi:hypothetical protein